MSSLGLSVLITAVDRATGPLGKIIRSLRGLRVISLHVGSALRSMMRVAARATGVLAGLAGVSFAGMGLGVLATGRTFERFRNQLEGLEGSSAEAQRSMDWVKNFAKRTPFELAQVMEAFIALKNYGIDPTQGSLEGLGDLAAQMGKPIMQAVEMMADAQQGEFERLKEFGIRASVSGRQVTFAYVKAGKDMAVSSRNSASAISAALQGIFSDKAAGAMRRQSQSFDGMWSNLKAMFNNFQEMIADSGVFAFLKGELASLLRVLDGLAANGKLAQWAKEISASMVSMLKGIKAATEGVDWVAATKGVFGFLESVAKVFKAIGGVSGLITGGGAAAIGWLTTSFMSLGAIIAGIAGVAAAPVVATIAIIGLLATAGWFVYRNWGKIVEGFGSILAKLQGLFSSVWDGIKSGMKTAMGALWDLLPTWLRMIFRGAAFSLRVVGRGLTNNNSTTERPTLPQPNMARRERLDAGGLVRFDFGNMPRGARARATPNDPRMAYDVSYRGGYGDAI
jgi:phage tail tape-measure protein